MALTFAWWDHEYKLKYIDYSIYVCTWIKFTFIFKSFHIYIKGVPIKHALGVVSSVLWNEVLEEVAKEYPEVEIKHILVDAAATLLCLNPGQFDVMVMENMFGDILSDQGGGILGSLGLMPSACKGPEKSYYEPSHGSAPDITGQNIANPYSMIGSVAMMLEDSFGMTEESKNVWNAMQSVFAEGYSTPDLSKPGADVKMIKTDEFGDRVVEALKNS